MAGGAVGAVMVAVSHPERPIGLRVIAFGVRHQPREARALSVYQIAHRRFKSLSACDEPDARRLAALRIKTATDLKGDQRERLSRIESRPPRTPVKSAGSVSGERIAR